MWSFFIALFGGIYYGSRYISDKRSHAVARQNTEYICRNHLEQQQSWKRKVIDMKLEIELDRLLRESTRSEVEKILLEIGWHKQFSIFFERDRENVLRLLMASKGKLLRKDAEIGVPSAVYGLPENYDQAHQNIESYELVKFIDERLRYHGVCEKMYIERTGVYNPLNENSAHIGGKYVWQPMLTLHPNIVEVPSYVRVYQEPHH